MEKGEMLTYFCDPKEIMHSCHGIVSYATWCRLEAKRINASRRGDKIVVVSNKRNQIALMRTTK